MANKTRFQVLPELEDFGNRYIKTIDSRAVLQGAIFMDGADSEVRLFWVIPETKTEKEYWGAKLLSYNKEINKRISEKHEQSKM